MDVLKRTSVTPGEGMDFVLSDGTLDRHGTRINPNGWELRNFTRNPIALFNHDRDTPVGKWSKLRVEKDRLIGHLELAAAGTSARIDELRKLVEQGILRAVSVGFRIIEAGLTGKSEFDFDKQELVECSLVAVGSNTNALALARSLKISEETISIAFGEQAETERRGGPTGEHAAKHPGKRAKTMNIAELIKAAQEQLNAARDALTERTTDDKAEATDIEALSSEVERCETRLASLERAEKALATRAAAGGVEGGQQRGKETEKQAARKPLGVQLREPKPADLIVRAAVVNMLALITKRDPAQILEERYGDHEATGIVTRAAVAGAKTTVAGWALELVETATVDFMESLRPISIFPQLAGLGTSLSFGPNRGAIKIPSRASTPSISGSFVLEGDPIPVRRLGLTSVTLSPTKMGVISVFSREIARYSNPQIEGLLRQEIQADTAITIDTLLLDAVAGSTTRPAGLTNGVTALTASSSGGFAGIIEDINALAAPFDSANAGRSLVLIMNPREARYLSATPGPDGRLGWAAALMDEFTIIRSTTVTAGHVYMIDAADFAAVAGTPEFDTSEQAVIHMEDTTPLQISTAGSPNTVAAPVQSMFQTAQIALRMLMDLNWSMRRTGMVQHITSVDWAPVAP